MKMKSDEFVNHSGVASIASLEPSGMPGSSHVAILLGLYDGADSLQAQLDSFTAQSHLDWSLIVSDDGSTDCGPDIVRTFAARHADRVRLVGGPRRGFAQNFLSLALQAGSNASYAAFSDQDDVWLPGKLTRALALLDRTPAGRPAIYAGRTVICDAFMKPLRRSPCWTLPAGFRNALVQSIAGGNTMVLNRAALDLVQKTARHAKGVVAHDWWIYQIVTGAGGDIVYDADPQVLYRQHGKNQIGANDTLSARIVRFRQIMAGRFRSWNSANIAALERASHLLTPEARETLTVFKSVRGGRVANRLRALRESRVYRQTHGGNAALYAAAILNRL